MDIALKTSLFRCFRICCLAFLGSGNLQGASPQEPSPRSAAISFSRTIQPILAKRCFSCHGPDVQESGLRFNDREAALGETASGSRAIVPGDLQASVLLERVVSADPTERMPPEGEPLGPEEVESLKAWIAQGAPWEQHWAFQPLQNPEPPGDVEADWGKNPVDAFIASALAERGLRPNPSADWRTLVRRAYLDLWGLPPTEAQIQAFLVNDSESRWADLIDQLLSSPHYGERWGRHWLDLVRYAETNSFERDGAKPNAWKYRDYVIRSFNDDKPYDQFLCEQMAGDELDVVTPETLAATGFYRLGIWDDEPADPLQARYDELDDLMTTAGQVFLGLTINCARCHDHKIDPIPQADYYSMLAYFADVTPYGTRGNQQENNQVEVSGPGVREKYQELDLRERQLSDALREIEQEGIVKMPAPDQRATEGGEREKVLREKLQSYLTADRWEEYSKKKDERKGVREQRSQLPPREFLLGLARCEPKPEPTRILLRGNPHVPGDEVQPRLPQIFGSASLSLPAVADHAKTLGRRRVFAMWLVSKENLLTSRVIANRIWQFHFGRGIVRSTNNFGQMGDPPTHPLLLDWLARRLMDEGWKLKPLHRLIMTSRAYQMSSRANDEGLAADPGNDMFWRFDPRRLSAEEVRDGILQASGSLNRETYGPSIYPELSAEVLAGQSQPGSGWGRSSEEQRNRRSVYIHVKRSLLTPILSVFDYPEPDRSCEARFMTLQPGQALSLMNSQFVHEQAAILARSIAATAGDQTASQIDRTIRTVLGRPATADETAEGLALIDQMRSEYAISPENALQLYCLTVLNWNEFMFVE